MWRANSRSSYGRRVALAAALLFGATLAAVTLSDTQTGFGPIVISTLRGPLGSAFALVALTVGSGFFLFRHAHLRQPAKLLLLAAFCSALSIFLIRFGWVGGSF